MMDSCKLSGQDVPVAKERVPELPPLSSSVLGMSSEPYVDRQETASRWKASDRTENGHCESEGAEKQSRAVQKEEIRTPNGVSTSTVEEVTSEVTSKTLETSRLHQPVTGQLASSPFSHSGLFSSGVNGSERQATTAVSGLALGASGQTPSQAQKLNPGLAQLKLSGMPEFKPNVTLEFGTQLSTKPFVDKQDTISHSKTAEETQTGRKETERQEKKSDAIQFSVTQTPTCTVSETVEKKSHETSFNSLETSTQPPCRAPGSTPPQNTLTKQDGSPANTFLQSISKYLFSWNDVPPANTLNLTSDVSKKENESGSNVSNRVQEPRDISNPLANVEKQGNGSQISESASTCRQTYERKTTDGYDGRRLSSVPTEMIQTNSKSMNASVRPAFLMGEALTSESRDQRTAEPTETIPKVVPSSLRESKTPTTKVDFKTGLSFFQSDMSGAPFPPVQQMNNENKTPLGQTSVPGTDIFTANAGIHDSQSAPQTSIKANPPACFTPKSWAPVKPPVPVKTRDQTAPSAVSSASGESKPSPFPALSSTCSSTSSLSTALTSASGICPSQEHPVAQTTCDVTDMKQSQTSMKSSEANRRMSDYGPVSAAPFPGSKTGPKSGSLHRANSLPSQETIQRGSFAGRISDIRGTHTASTGEAASEQFSKTIKPETEERRRAPPASSEGRGQSVGQPPSHEGNLSRAPTAPFKSAGITATPYVDQQETVSRSQVSERTGAAQREAESEETRKQTVQHAVSRTPTGSSSPTVEEQSTRTVSQSKEVTYGPSPQWRPTLQEPASKSNGVPQWSDQASRAGAAFDIASNQMSDTSSLQSRQQPKLIEEEVTKPRANTVTSLPKFPISIVPGAVTRGISAHSPCADRQETYSHSKISEKTETGQRDSATAEKAQRSHQQSVSKTPGGVAFTTVDEQATVSMSETKETSGYVTMPTSRSASCGFPSSTTNLSNGSQSGIPKELGASYLEQGLKQSMTGKSREGSERQRNPGIFIAPTVQSPSQPVVDRQETFHRSKTSEETKSGTRETDAAEKSSQSYQQSFTRSPSTSSTTTTEEKCFQSMSETHETSRKQILGGNSQVQPRTTTPVFGETIKPTTIPPRAGSAAAPERVSASIQRARSADERCRTPREHVIPIRLVPESAAPSASHTLTAQESRARPSQQRREHIIPVRLSPFPARRPFLRETSADRRHSVAAWPGLDWGQPPSADWWLSSDWGRPVRPAGGQSAEGLRPAALWPELHPQQPAFHCPVVGGPQTAALAALYSPPPPAGAANST